MALVTCRDCGSSISDAAPACIYCGRPRSSDEAGPTDPPVRTVNKTTRASPPISANPDPIAEPHGRAEPLPFYALDVTKFVILSICTFGLYELYWFYRGWQRVRDQYGRDLSPFWRAFFAPLWGFSLFREIRDYASGHGRFVGWTAGLQGTLYLLWVATWRLPDPWWLISLFSFVPVIPVLHTVNELAVQQSVMPNRTYSAKHIAVIVLGGLFAVLAVVGTFMPAE